MNKALVLGGLAVSLAIAVTAVYVYRVFEAPEKQTREMRPKRVWVEYSEKYKQDDYEKPADDPLLAEQRLQWLISENKGCIVLTRNRARADYLVSISVTRNIGGATFGDASLSITDKNGDVVVAESFYQDRDSREDIATMPISATWRHLCSSGASK